MRRLARQLPAVLPLLAAALAGWWLVATAVQWLSPKAPALLALRAPQPQADAGSVAQQSWFGSSQQGLLTQAAPPLQVIGVLGGGQGSSQDFAIVMENGQLLPLRVGEQSHGGWWLRRVDGRGIVIQQTGGQAQRVVLSSTAGSAAQAVQPVPTVTGQLTPAQPLSLAPAAAAAVSAPPVAPVMAQEEAPKD